MKSFHVRDREQADSIIRAYEHCRTCGDCPLNNPEGWRCSYLYEQAQKYVENHTEDGGVNRE